MITKKMDDLGRIVIPKEFRQQLGIEEGESLEISIQDNRIVIERETSADVEVEDALTKEEYQGVVQETIEDVQDYLGKVSELLEELQHLDLW